MKKILLSLIVATSIFASEITIAAAASYRNALEEIATVSDIKLKLIFGASGKLYHQITNGAPFDLFMAADMKYPTVAHENGFASGEVSQTVRNRLILWSRTIDLSKGMDSILDKKVRKISIANPKTAPLGERAVESLKHHKLYDKIEKKLIYGESISQATHFVESGAAEIGITGYSVVANIISDGKGYYHILDSNSHKDMTYGSIVVKSSKNQKEAVKFLEFLKSEKASKILEKHGFEVVR